jgi:NAD(P)H-hydrate epimerase
VLDADALTLLALAPGWHARLTTPPVLTPHPGEMARLCGLTTSEVQSNRWTLAQAKAQEWGSIVLLKGAHTVIASPDGELAVLPFKTPALAKAGSGDVLAGVIAGLMVQGCSAWDAALTGAVLHALAGEAAALTCASARAVLASDVLASLGQAFRALEPLAARD